MVFALYVSQAEYDKLKDAFLQSLALGTRHIQDQGPQMHSEKTNTQSIHLQSLVWDAAT